MTSQAISPNNTVSGLYFDTKVFRSTAGVLSLGAEYGIDTLIHQGGTYSGKTYSILLALHAWAKQQKEDMIISVVSCTVPHLKRGALRDWVNICEKLGGMEGWNKTDNIFHLGKTTLEFFSADDDGKVRGGKRDVLFVNEANLINYERFRQLSMRTRKCVILDYNPVSEFWAHEKLIGRSSTLFKITTYKDNPSTPPKVIKDIERLKETDPELYRVYGEGMTGSLQGVIFTNINVVPEFPVDYKRAALGLDFGFTNDPTAVVMIAQAHGELYCKEVIYETGMTNDDIYKELRAQGLHGLEVWADAAEPKSIEELRRLGLNVRAAEKGPESVRLGISILKKYRINITADSANWRKEASNYRWKIDANGNTTNTPMDDWNHCWDAARYWAIMKLRNRASGIRFANPTTSR